MYDVFLCHASEDKTAIVEPLYEALTKIGVHAFYDSREIAWGGSRKQSIRLLLSRNM
ncbi:TIR domain-containing protein [Pseudomonas fragariae (ex Marin et al. 2024)]|uniref:TIR domain-containing protein n=1 Tax=Pseudomonas fragariae (ex Marin et al. 2024) TaxID=3080056 RepID=UPI003F78DD3F